MPFVIICTLECFSKMAVIIEIVSQWVEFSCALSSYNRRISQKLNEIRRSLFRGKLYDVPRVAPQMHFRDLTSETRPFTMTCVVSFDMLDFQNLHVKLSFCRKFSV